MTKHIESNNAGFTLLEILFALSLFSIAVSALFPAFLSHIRFNNFSEVRSSAYSAAQVVLDDLRLQDPSGLPNTGDSAAQSVSIGARTFSVVTSYCEENAYCSSSTRYLTVRVSYRSEEIYEVSTIYTQLR